MMRQNRLFTSIYVAGTGLSIAFTMVLFIIYYVKFAPIYPEYNRDRTLVISKSAISQEGKDRWNSCSGGASPRIVELVKGLPHLDKVSASAMEVWSDCYVLIPQTGAQQKVTPGYVDTGFWQVFTFRFLAGKPFGEAEVKAGSAVAVLTANLAKRIFASTDVVGQRFTYEGRDMQVVGVVEDVTGATPATAADLYIPLYYGGESNWYRPSPDDRGLQGNCQIHMTATSAADLDALRAEIIDVLNRYDQEDTKWTNYWMDQPDTWWKSTFRDSCSNPPDVAGILRGVLYMLLALLFIPAMNLCGMISSRMDERMSELGVRKAYGATNSSLILQVLTENLLLTLVGGLLGLVLAYMVAFTGGEWMYHLFDTFVMPGGVNPDFTTEMLFNPTLFGIVLGLCLVLNLISALVPTILALRHSIIYSIQTKR